MSTEARLRDGHFAARDLLDAALRRTLEHLRHYAPDNDEIADVAEQAGAALAASALSQANYGYPLASPPPAPPGEATQVDESGSSEPSTYTVFAPSKPRPAGERASAQAVAPGLDYSATWREFEAYEDRAAKQGIGMSRDQMTGASMMLSWLCNRDKAAAYADADREAGDGATGDDPLPERSGRPPAALQGDGPA